MPTGSGLSIGAGIAGGANAFVQSFLQARRLKNEEALQKNAFLVQVLTRQLEDDTLPYDERAKILDQIPNLLGVAKKMDRPLSQMLGLDKFNDKRIEISPAQKGSPATPNQTITDTENATALQNVGATPNITMKGMQEVPDVPAITERQGSLSPAFIKKRLIVETEAAKDQSDLEKQAKLLAVNYRLQAQILNKGGYTKEVFRGYDPAGNFIITMTNGQDTKSINLGKVESEALAKAKITASKTSSGGNLGQLRLAEQIVQEYQTDPSSHSYSDYTAAQSFLDNFEKTGQLKSAQIGNLDYSS